MTLLWTFNYLRLHKVGGLEVESGRFRGSKFPYLKERIELEQYHFQILENGRLEVVWAL